MEFPSSSVPAAANGAASAAIDALLAVLRPLARMAIDHGVQFNQLEELTKRAMVEAALHAVRDEVGTGSAPISRLSVISGIHRKEVKRLVETPDLGAVRSEQTPASELSTRWSTMPEWLEADGSPRALPRRPQETGIPSFETLARSVTTDVHPRTLLDELLRLGRVEFDPSADLVRLRGDTLVPAGRIEALLAFAGASVGDHLSAVRENLVAGHRIAAGDPDAKPPFVEQSVFADELSADSVVVAGARARALWTKVLKTIAPELQQLEDADREAGRAGDHRLRIGLYCYAELVAPASGTRPAAATAPIWRASAAAAPVRWRSPAARSPASVRSSSTA